MFTQPQLVLLAVLISAPIYWLLPREWSSARQYLLIAVSLLLIAHESVLAVWACIAVTSWTFLATQAMARLATSGLTEQRWIRIGSFWLAILGTILPLLMLDLRAEPIAIIGLSYIVIKSVSVVIDTSASGNAPAFGKILILNSFFPIFSAGPIEDQSTFDKSKFQKDLTRDDLVFGVYRMLEGFILSYFIGQNIILAALDQYTQTAYVDPDVVGFSVIVVILLKFLYLYINFTGYTSFAIGLAAFFGLRVRENFRYPFLARNPEEFWSRWHMSLGQFISKYLYFRMLVILKRPQLALFLAFVIVGLWHSIGLQYLLWGVGHGAYLVLFLAVKRRYAKSFTVLPAPIKILVGIAGWAFTMFWVSFLSFMANAPDFQTVGEIMARVF